MASVSSLGLGAGVLTSDVIDKLKKADEEQHLTPLTNEKKNIEKKQKALNDLIKDLTELKDIQDPLSDELTYLTRTVNVSGDAVKVTAEKGSDIQNFNIKVNKMAKPEVYKTGMSFKSKDDKILTSKDSDSVFQFYARVKQVDKDDKVTYVEKHITIDIDKDTTWGELPGKISTATGGSVKALIINTGSTIPYRIIMQSTEPGTSNKIYMGNTVKGNAISDNYYTSGDGKDGVSFLGSPTSDQFKINGASKELFTNDFKFTGFDQTINSKELEKLQTLSSNVLNEDILFKTNLEDIETSASSAVDAINDSSDSDSAISKLRHLESQLTQQITRGTSGDPIPTNDTFEQKTLVSKINNIIDTSQSKQIDNELTISKKIESIRDRLENMKSVYNIDESTKDSINTSQYEYIEGLLKEIDELQNDDTNGSLAIIKNAISNLSSGSTATNVAPDYPEELPEVVTSENLDQLENAYKKAGQISEKILDKLDFIDNILDEETSKQDKDNGVELKGLEIIAHMINFRSKDTKNYAEYKGIQASVSDDGRQLILNDANGDSISASGELIKYFGLTKDSYVENIGKDDNNDKFASSQKLMDEIFNFESIQKAQNAEIEFNGVAIKHGTNKLDDLITGINIELQKENSISSVSVKGNDEKIEEDFKKFIEKYNKVAININKLIDYDRKKKVSGALQGESIVTNILSQLSTTLLKTFSKETYEQKYNTLVAIGLRADTDGTLNLDTKEFNEAMKNPKNIRALFDGWKEEHTYVKKDKDGKDKEYTSTTYHDGAFEELKKTLKNLVDGNDSLLEKLSKSYTDRIDRIDKNYEKEEETLKNRYDNMKKQFAAYDSQMAALQRSFNALKAQMDSENK